MIQKQLSLLGDCITTYKGEGVLTLKDGFSISCTFEAGQLKQGDVFLFCDCSALTVSSFYTPAHKFEGTTTQGYAFASIDNIIQTDQEAGIHIYFLRSGTVRIAKQTFPQKVRYGVTNLIIKHPLRIQINHKGIIQQLVIEPVHNYDFLEKTYSPYVANRERYALDQGTIDTYLDAKAESDYLQIRGIKLAVAMEVLKDIFLNLSDTPVAEFVTKPNRFKKVIAQLKDAILPVFSNHSLKITAETLSEKLPDINRRTFREILDDIFKQIDLQLTEGDTQRFIQSRNSLVHTGRFKSEEKARGSDTEPLIDEFCFLMSVLDKVFLRLLEYHGQYIDRRVPSQPNPYAHI